MKWPLVCLASIPPIEPYLSARRTHPASYPAQLSFAAILFEREQYYAALYNPHSQYGEKPPTDHDHAWQPFPVTSAALAILRDLRHLNTAEPPSEQPYDLFGLKGEALAGLTTVLRPAKTHRLGYLIACQFSNDLCFHEEARELEQVAARFTTTKRDATSWIAAQDAILELFRRQAWRVRKRVEGERFTRFIKSEGEFCEEERQLAMVDFNLQQVPKPLQKLVPLARQYGVGDDPCRAYFLSKISKQNRKRILQEVEPHFDAIDRWIKTFEAGRLPPEAVAFFWLLEAIEEMRHT
jgi:hypothetical protein